MPQYLGNFGGSSHFYSLWIKFIREIDWYPSFLKFTTSKKIFYLLKDMTFKNMIYLINRIHIVWKFYMITCFYTLFMQLVRGITL